MRASQEEKERSHRRIIASAAKLARRDGIAGASVADVMRDAGLTHGGFYKHFDSKEALLGAALDSAFEEIFAMLDAGSATDAPAAKAVAFQAFYLSDEHVASPSMGCPVAALSGDVARETIGLKAKFGEGVRRIAATLARGRSGPEGMRRARALRQFATMAGAVMIARASDPDTAREVLLACRARTE